MTWKDDQQYEKEWHGSCVNSWWEEMKQQHYARLMELKAIQASNEKYPVYEMKGKSVLDIGGGAYSLLLKCEGLKNGTVIDPCDYPQWTLDRYKAAGIKFLKKEAEDMILSGFDEVWIYNCLQHVKDPEKVIQNAKKSGKLIRIFEWIERGITPGHPHNLHRNKLDEWLGAKGNSKVFFIGNVNFGLCYYGVFKT